MYHCVINLPAKYGPAVIGPAKEKKRSPSAGDIRFLPTTSPTIVGAVPTIQPSPAPKITMYTAKPPYSDETNGQSIVDKAIIPRQIKNIKNRFTFG